MKPGVQGVYFLYAGKNKGIESVTDGMILIHRMQYQVKGPESNLIRLSGPDFKAIVPAPLYKKPEPGN